MGIGYKLFHPEIFQGSLSRRKYFEGWYYKMVSADEMKAIAIIPGIALFNKKERHAFIQVFNGVDHTTSYHRFDIGEFKAGKKELDITIGKNHFSKQGVTLDLPEIKGEISFSNMISPVSSLMSPGVMGWFSYVPFMQCRHGVVSMHHDLIGETSGTFGNTDWRDGIGYIEKDWGASFPKCWIWMHSNHFDVQKPASIMASVAHIPWMGRFFPGFIVVLVIEGIEYRFATYNQSQMKCLVFDDLVLLEFKLHDLHLLITAYRGETATLHMPVQGQMTGKMSESLRARLEIRLLKNDHEIWSSNGTTAGLDIYGDTSVLESSAWRK